MKNFAATLLDDLRARGADLTVDGTVLRWRAPKGALAPADVKAISANKGDLIDLLTRTASGETPAAQLGREWAAVLRQVRAEFRQRGLSPSAGTEKCAAWLEMELVRGWPDGRGIDRETAQEWLEALLSGKAIGRLTDSGRPVIRLAASADKDPF